MQDHKASKQFEMIAIDIGAMPLSLEGNCCFLLVIDSFSKLVTATALPNQRARTLARCLWSHWFSYYGIPRFLISDQGKNVSGNEILSLCKGLGIKKLQSSSYHPQGNGSAERAIGSIKALLRSMCLSRNINIREWDRILPEAVLNQNSAPNHSSKYSPFQTSFGINLDRLLGVDRDSELHVDLIRKNAALNREEARANYQKAANKNNIVHDYKPGDEVVHGEHPKLNPLSVGPFLVVKKIGPVNFAIQDTESGKTKIVHHDLLRPAGYKNDASILPFSYTYVYWAQI